MLYGFKNLQIWKKTSKLERSVSEAWGFLKDENETRMTECTSGHELCSFNCLYKSQRSSERTSTANAIRRRLAASSNTVVSDQTVRNRLHGRDMRARKPAIRPKLTERHRVWCTQHVRWTRQQWGQVLFSDESRFCLQLADGRIRVWRRREERFEMELLLQETVMVEDPLWCREESVLITRLPSTRLWAI